MGHVEGNGNMIIKCSYRMNNECKTYIKGRLLDHQKCNQNQMDCLHMWSNLSTVSRKSHQLNCEVLCINYQGVIGLYILTTEELLRHLNGVRLTIKFTVEHEKDGALPFLDSGEERMAAWMSLSTGSPCIQTGISTSSPIIRPT